MLRVIRLNFQFRSGHAWRSFKVGIFFKTDMCGPITSASITAREQGEASFALPSWHAEDWGKGEGKPPRVQLVDIIEERQTLDANTEITVFYGEHYFRQ